MERIRRWLRREDGTWSAGGSLVEPSNLVTEVWIGVVIAVVGGVCWLAVKAVSWAFG